MKEQNNDQKDFESSKFKMPSKIIKQLNEMSGGGFIFFILDEKGEPCVYETYDSSAYESLVKSFAIDWLAAERQVRREDLKDEIRLNNGSWEIVEEEFDDEDDGDYEDDDDEDWEEK